MIRFDSLDMIDSLILFKIMILLSSFCQNNNIDDKNKKRVQKAFGRFRAVYFESGRTSLERTKERIKNYID
jgi:hypothetical protein